MKKTSKILYLTSGYSIQALYSETGLQNLAIFGIRGGYIGQLKYRDEDIDKIISALKDTLPEGRQT